MNEIEKLKIERLELQVKILQENSDRVKKSLEGIISILEQMNSTGLFIK